MEIIVFRLNLYYALLVKNEYSRYFILFTKTMAKTISVFGGQL